MTSEMYPGSNLRAFLESQSTGRYCTIMMPAVAVLGEVVGWTDKKGKKREKGRSG
jgi:hypothetical protein